MKTKNTLYKFTPELLELVAELIKFSHSAYNQYILQADLAYLRGYALSAQYTKSQSPVYYTEKTKVIFNRIRETYCECLVGEYNPYISHHMYSPHIPIMNVPIGSKNPWTIVTAPINNYKGVFTAGTKNKTTTQ